MHRAAEPPAAGRGLKTGLETSYCTFVITVMSKIAFFGYIYARGLAIMIIKVQCLIKRAKRGGDFVKKCGKKK